MVRRAWASPEAPVSCTSWPGAIAVWSPSVVTVMSAVTQSLSCENWLKRRALSSSSLGGRSSAGRPCLRRLVRSSSRPRRVKPTDGVISRLLTKLPLGTMAVSGRSLGKPRCSSVVVKPSVRDSPGCMGAASA